MRHIGLDVHRDFCDVAIAEDGTVRSAGRIRTSVEEIELFAQSLGPDDEVGLETTGNALAIARIVEPFVARVVVADTRNLRAITHAKVKSDPVDARMLARLLASGMLPEVWRCDEETRILRRRVSRRTQLVRQRTRAKNQIHAVLIRNLKGKPPVTDVFGRKGRRWLAELEVPEDERHTVDGCLREVDFLSEEVATLDKALARHAVSSPEVRRLMTIPGVSTLTAVTLMAAIGDIRRFPSPRHLVGYLGLDPRVRQSGEAPARHGRISKQGDAAARHVLVEAAHSVERAPGPLRAFKRRVQARRGFNIAIVAVARKLATIAWHLLTKQEDYAYARPALTYRKLRQAELAAGAQKRSNPRGSRGPATPDRPTQWHREREVATQAERAYERLVKDLQATGRSGRAQPN